MPPDVTITSAIIGLFSATTIAYAGWKAHALSRGGAIVSAVVGATVFIGGGLPAAACLIAFFISGSLLSRMPQAVTKESRARDWKQVLANGGVGSLAIVLVQLHILSPACMVIFYGSLAAATADTWATEIGTRFGGEPLDLLRLRRTSRGMSGGVTIAGTLATIAGAVSIAAIASPYCLMLVHRWSAAFWAISLGGVAGSLADTIAGGLFQRKFSCPKCCTKTEHRVHCGVSTVSIGGISWVENNTVNLIGTLVGGVVSRLLLDIL